MQTTIYKTLQIEQQEPKQKIGGTLRCSGMVTNTNDKAGYDTYSLNNDGQQFHKY